MSKGLCVAILVVLSTLLIATLWSAKLFIERPVAQLNTTGHIIHPAPNPHQIVTKSEWRSSPLRRRFIECKWTKGWKAEKGLDYP